MELTEHFLRPPLLSMRFYGSTKKPVPFRKQQELVSIKKSQRDENATYSFIDGILEHVAQLVFADDVLRLLDPEGRTAVLQLARC